MNELETRLRARLTALVDDDLGPRRPPPPFQPDHTEIYPATARRLTLDRPLLLSLVAAACVVAILLSAFGLSRLAADGPPPPITTPTPTPTATSTPTPSATPTPTVSDPSRTPSTRPVAGPKIVELDGARIPLPSGWVVRQEGDDYWCLSPASTRDTKGDYLCPIEFRMLHPTSEFAVSDMVGFIADPGYCGYEGGTTHIHREQRSLGGRSAYYRHTQINCRRDPADTNPPRPHWDIEYYIVATDPAYVLSSAVLTPAIDKAMTEIARHSTLPQQVAPVPLYNIGYVRSVTRTDQTMYLRVDLVRGTDRGYETLGQTKTFAVPLAMFKGPEALPPLYAHPKVGQLEIVTTDGQQVLGIRPVAFEPGS